MKNILLAGTEGFIGNNSIECYLNKYGASK